MDHETMDETAKNSWLEPPILIAFFTLPDRAVSFIFP
jgi:hypothetical protein